MVDSDSYLRKLGEYREYLQSEMERRLKPSDSHNLEQSIRADEASTVLERAINKFDRDFPDITPESTPERVASKGLPIWPYGDVPDSPLSVVFSDSSKELKVNIEDIQSKGKFYRKRK